MFKSWYCIEPKRNWQVFVNRRWNFFATRCKKCCKKMESELKQILWLTATKEKFKSFKREETRLYHFLPSIIEMYGFDRFIRFYKDRVYFRKIVQLFFTTFSLDYFNNSVSFNSELNWTFDDEASVKTTLYRCYTEFLWRSVLWPLGMQSRYSEARGRWFLVIRNSLRRIKLSCQCRWATSLAEPQVGSWRNILASAVAMN